MTCGQASFQWPDFNVQQGGHYGYHGCIIEERVLAVVELLDIRDITIALGGKRLIERLSLTIHSGEIVALMGPSGCGKTTLLRTLAGLICTTGGSVALRGQQPQELGWPQYRRRVLLVSQQPVLLDQSVEENLRRPFSYRSAPNGFPEARARGLLSRLGLDSFWQTNARTLSVGQQQRVALVRALVIQPDVLLLDEPTSALDESTVASVESLLKDEVREAGALVITHQRSQAQRWCDRLVELDPFLAGSVGGDQP